MKTIDGTARLLTAADVVLDLGCGSGQTSIDLAPGIARVHGIDTSGSMIELAKQKLRARGFENVDFSQADAFDKDLEEHSFSAITALNVLHLLDDLPGVLDRLYRLLAPGGLLVSETPCLRERNWTFRALVGLAKKSGIAPPIRALTFDEMAPLMISSGFEVVDIEVWDERDAVQRVVARKPTTPDASGNGD